MRSIVIALVSATFFGAAGDLAANGKDENAVAHTATGIVKKVEPAASRVTLRHEAIAALGWPAMTMPFAVKDRRILTTLKPDQRVEFTFVQQGGAPVITAIR